MKLILSSSDFGNPKSAQAIYNNLCMPVEKCKVLYFPNEKVTEAKLQSNKYYERLMHFGFLRENIIVFNYFAPQVLITTQIDVVYISGGNTFGIMKFLRLSGADKLIVELVKSGAIYIGGSAGAHIASANISHVAKYDIDTYGLTDFSGLGLFDGIIICHYCSDRFNDYKCLVEQNKYQVVKLSDEENLIIESIY